MKTDAELKISDIKQNPQNHKHDFNGLIKCSTINGSINAAIIDAHSLIDMGSNGGVDCDVTSGPCACGATH